MSLPLRGGISLPLGFQEPQSFGLDGLGNRFAFDAATKVVVNVYSVDTETPGNLRHRASFPAKDYVYALSSHG